VTRAAAPEAVFVLDVRWLGVSVGAAGVGVGAAALAGVVLCGGAVWVVADFERGGEVASGALAGIVGAGELGDFALLDVAGFVPFVGSDGRRVAMVMRLLG